MPKQWWSSPSILMAQGACVVALFAWSVHHSPTAAAKSAPAAPAAPRATTKPPVGDAVIDNSEDTAATDSLGGSRSRVEAPPVVPFRTENPPPGSLNLRPLEARPSAPWQPVHPQNPPQRLPSGPRSPFEANGTGATVYNPPPADAN